MLLSDELLLWSLILESEELAEPGFCLLVSLVDRRTRARGAG